MTDPQRESEANTPSVPDSAAINKLLDYINDHGCYAEEGGRCIGCTEALTAFGRAQYERGVRESDKKIIEAYQTGLKRGMAEGIEKAAEVADKVTQKVSGLLATDKLTVMDYTLEIEYGIRALLPPSEGATE